MKKIIDLTGVSVPLAVIVICAAMAQMPVRAVETGIYELPTVVAPAVPALLSGETVAQGELPVDRYIPANPVSSPRGFRRSGAILLSQTDDVETIVVPDVPDIVFEEEEIPFEEEDALFEEEEIPFEEEDVLFEEGEIPSEEGDVSFEGEGVDGDAVSDDTGIGDAPTELFDDIEEEGPVSDDTGIGDAPTELFDDIEEEGPVSDDTGAGDAPSELFDDIEEEGAVSDDTGTGDVPLDLFDDDFEEEELGDLEDIPPVIDRPLGIDEGEVIVVSEFVLQDANDYPDQGIFLEELREQLRQAVEEKPDGFTIGQMQEVVDRVSAYYRERDLILAQAVLPVQDVGDDGKVIVQVFEGRLGRVLVEDNDLYGERVLREPFDQLVGEPVVAQKIESALLRLTDYPGLTVFGLFQPGLRVGEADLALKVQNEDRMSFPVQVDNQGTDNTGILRFRTSINVNNPTDGADVFSATLQKGFNPNNQRFWRINYRRTLGRGFLFNFHKENNRFDVGGAFADREIAGNTNVFGLGVEKSFFRSRQRNYGTNVGLTLKESITRQGGRLISLDELSVLNFSFNYDSVDAVRQGLNFATLDLYFGFNDLLGAMGGSQYARDRRAGGRASSRSGPDDTYAEGKFSKVLFNFTRLQTISTHQALLLRGELQWTKDLLTPLEQYSVGGPDNVRGYPVAEVLWDRAAFFSVEYLLDAPFIADNPAFGNRRWGELIQMSLFYDQATGSLVNPLPTVQKGTVTYRSAGWGLRLNVPGRVASRLMVALPVGEKIVDPVSGAYQEREDSQIWADLTVTF